MWSDRIHPDPTVDQATAEFFQAGGTLWIHTYLVWSHVTIYATITGPQHELRDRNNWATEALQSIPWPQFNETGGQVVFKVTDTDQ